MNDDIRAGRWKVPELSEEDLARVMERATAKAAAHRVRRRRIAAAAGAAAIGIIAAAILFERSSFDDELRAAQAMLAAEIERSQEKMALAAYDLHEKDPQEGSYEEHTIRD